MTFHIRHLLPLRAFRLPPGTPPLPPPPNTHTPSSLSLSPPPSRPFLLPLSPSSADNKAVQTQRRCRRHRRRQCSPTSVVVLAKSTAALHRRLKLIVRSYRPSATTTTSQPFQRRLLSRSSLGVARSHERNELPFTCTETCWAMDPLSTLCRFSEVCQRF